MAARAASYSYICQPVDYSDDPNEVRVSVLPRRQTDTHPHTLMMGSVCLDEAGIIHN